MPAELFGPPTGHALLFPLGYSRLFGMSRVIREDDVTIIELDSSYDSLDDVALEEFGGMLLSEADCADPARLILDFSRTNFIGSSFIELMVRAWKRIQQREGVMVLCEVQPLCREIFQITRLDSIWRIYPTRSEALAALRGS